MKYYGLTLKVVILETIPTPQDYEEWMYMAMLRYPTINIINSCYELDSAQRLHYHCFFKGPDRLIYKSLLRKHMHQHFDVLKTDLDRVKWNNYIDMEKTKHVEYMFVDNGNIL